MLYIRNLKYQNINNLSIEIKKGTWVSVVGDGKSTLFDFLSGKIDNEGHININGLELKRSTIKDASIVCLDSIPGDSFINKTVIGNMSYSIRNFSYSYQNSKMLELIDYFDLNDLLYRNPNNLSAGEKQIVELVSQLVLEPKILILDDALTYIDKITRKKVYTYIKKLIDNGMIFINMTSDMDDIIDSDQIIILGDKAEVCTIDELNEKQLKKNNLKLPFILDLSYKLIDYNVIDKPSNSISKLVNKIWK